MLIKMWYNKSMGKIKGSYYKTNNATHKVCTKCGVRKERSEYHKDSSRNDGIGAYCKECKLKTNNSWRKANPEEMKQSQRRTRRKREYGVTREDYEIMLVNQNNECAICKNSIGYEASVDHDHQTGKVRGLLCGKCNSGIGLLQDNPEILRSAAKYLDQYL